jgi:copper chaperone CopZ
MVACGSISGDECLVRHCARIRLFLMLEMTHVIARTPTPCKNARCGRRCLTPPASQSKRRVVNVKTCWEIRRELQAGAYGNGRPSGWLISCAECSVPLDGRACWEQCAGSPCCCAPLHITCDFCEIYIEHRREIAGRTQRDAISAVASTPEALLSPQGGNLNMEKVQFNVPDLWADHHTLKVREVLSQLAGVQDVIASPAFRLVAVSYDPALTTPGAVMATLEEAGYPVATDGVGVMAHPVAVQDGRKDPAWDRLGVRRTLTDPRDAKK